MTTRTTTTGKLRPVCSQCGKLGRAVAPDHRGSVNLFDLAAGWRVAPFPGPDADVFTCGDCDADLRRRFARKGDR